MDCLNKYINKYWFICPYILFVHPRFLVKERKRLGANGDRTLDILTLLHMFSEAVAVTDPC